MSRVLAIDFGEKRTGIAVTDPLRIIASGLVTVPTNELRSFLRTYIPAEGVETVVLGEPLHPDGNPAQIAPLVYKLKKELEKEFPDVRFELQDERYTSKEATDIIRNSGYRRKKRREKELVDKISAALILQDYMEKNVW